MSPKLQAKVKEKVDEYDKQISQYKSSVLKEEETLAKIKQITDLSDTEIALETSKENMRKYIQLLIDRIYAVYKTVRLTIIQVKLNPGVVVPFTTPEEPSTSSDTPVYLIVDGIQGVSPKLRCIYSPSISFNATDGTFKYGERIITTKDVLEDADDDFSRELPFRRLNIYQDDIPKNKK